MVAASFEASSVKASDSVDDAVKIATRSVGMRPFLTNRMAASFACAKSPELVLTSSKKSAINLGTAAAAAPVVVPLEDDPDGFEPPSDLASVSRLNAAMARTLPSS